MHVLTLIIQAQLSSSYFRLPSANERIEELRRLQESLLKKEQILAADPAQKSFRIMLRELVIERDFDLARIAISLFPQFHSKVPSDIDLIASAIRSATPTCQYSCEVSRLKFLEEAFTTLTLFTQKHDRIRPHLEEFAISSSSTVRRLALKALFLLDADVRFDDNLALRNTDSSASNSSGFLESFLRGMGGFGMNQGMRERMIRSEELSELKTNAHLALRKTLEGSKTPRIDQLESVIGLAHCHDDEEGVDPVTKNFLRLITTSSAHRNEVFRLAQIDKRHPSETACKLLVMAMKHKKRIRPKVWPNFQKLLKNDNEQLRYRASSALSTIFPEIESGAKLILRLKKELISYDPKRFVINVLLYSLLEKVKSDERLRRLVLKVLRREVLKEGRESLLEHLSEPCLLLFGKEVIENEKLRNEFRKIQSNWYCPFISDMIFCLHQDGVTPEEILDFLEIKESGAGKDQEANKSKLLLEMYQFLLVALVPDENKKEAKKAGDDLIEFFFARIFSIVEGSFSRFSDFALVACQSQLELPQLTRGLGEILKRKHDFATKLLDKIVAPGKEHAYWSAFWLNVFSDAIKDNAELKGHLVNLWKKRIKRKFLRRGFKLLSETPKTTRRHSSITDDMAPIENERKEITAGVLLLQLLGTFRHDLDIRELFWTALSCSVPRLQVNALSQLLRDEPTSEQDLRRLFGLLKKGLLLKHPEYEKSDSTFYNDHVRVAAVTLAFQRIAEQSWASTELLSSLDNVTSPELFGWLLETLPLLEDREAVSDRLTSLLADIAKFVRAARVAESNVKGKQLPKITFPTRKPLSILSDKKNPYRSPLFRYLPEIGKITAKVACEDEKLRSELLDFLNAFLPGEEQTILGGAVNGFVAGLGPLLENDSTILNRVMHWMKTFPELRADCVKAMANSSLNLEKIE